MSKLNPQITSVEIGIRELREITVYPLSLSDQISLSKIIAGAASEYVNSEDQSDMAFAAFISKAINENLANILTLVTDEKGGTILGEITNTQAVNIAEILYEVNYGGVIKNVRSLMEKVKKV